MRNRDHLFLLHDVFQRTRFCSLLVPGSQQALLRLLLFSVRTQFPSFLFAP
jgi:hypothetical protein